MEDSKKRILFLFGTRPEAIKMAPVIKKFKEEETLTCKVCVTAQHREMLDQVLDFFKIQPDYDLDIMEAQQDLFSLSAKIFATLKIVLEDFKPDIVCVHGDTTTSTMGALSAYYYGAKVAHIEAGLRTYDKQAPFPEEVNRQLTARIADFHFAPTHKALENLIHEGVSHKSIAVTGNTVVDALEYTLKVMTDKVPEFAKKIPLQDKIILVTGHRRENFDGGLQNVCEVLREVAVERKQIRIVYPVHLNPKVQETVKNSLAGLDNVHLIPPLNYPDFIWLMHQSHLIVTDSGGIQEEAPSLGKPVLLTRKSTERPEAIDDAFLQVVGNNKSLLKSKILTLLDDTHTYTRLSQLPNPYGDGTASQQILNYIKRA